jgi:gliding motility-associated lipoprotein GldH
MKKNIFLLFILVFVFACQKEKPIFEQSYSLEKGCWSWEEAISFSFPSPDTIKKYNLYLEVENQRDYEFQNLYCKIITQFPDSTQTEQIVSFDLFTSKGLQNGTCKKDLCTVQFVMQEDFMFEKEGLYTLTFNQYMRNPIQDNLHKITLRLLASSNE